MSEVSSRDWSLILTVIFLSLDLHPYISTIWVPFIFSCVFLRWNGDANLKASVEGGHKSDQGENRCPLMHTLCTPKGPPCLLYSVPSVLSHTLTKKQKHKERKCGPLLPQQQGPWDSCCEWQKNNEALFVLQWRGVARQQEHDVVATTILPSPTHGVGFFMWEERRVPKHVYLIVYEEHILSQNSEKKQKKTSENQLLKSTSSLSASQNLFPWEPWLEDKLCRVLLST